MPIPTPAERIERANPNAAALAEAVSLAIRIEPQLLRKARVNLFPAFDAGVEADMWFSPLVESRAASGIVLQQPVAAILRERLGHKPAMLEAAWGVIEGLHRKISPAIFAEERLAYLVLAGKHAEARELLRSLVATLVSRRGRDLAGWAAKAISRLPREALGLEEAQMLAFGASLRSGDRGELENGLTSVRAAEWAGWLSPDDLEMAAFGVTLLEDGVEFGPVGRPRSHRIELPKTTPVVVEVGWHDGAYRRTERTAVNPNGQTIVDLGQGVTEVDIRTVLGDSYWLTTPAQRERESRQKKVGRVQLPRVHIMYEVQSGDAIEKKELPFVVGVMGDLSGRAAKPLPRLRDRKFVPINADNFDDVVRATKPRLVFQVAGRLGTDGGKLGVELNFERLADFEPAAVARQVGPTRDLLEKRIALSKIRSMLRGNQRLEDRLDARRAAEELLDETAKVGRDRAREPTDEFADNTSPSDAADIEAAVANRIAELDARLSEQVSEFCSIRISRLSKQPGAG